MATIKILGTGCAGCRALFTTVEKVVADLNIKATVVKEEDMENILQYNVMRLPALLIDEKVVSTGKLTEEQVVEILKDIKDEGKKCCCCCG